MRAILGEWDDKIIINNTQSSFRVAKKTGLSNNQELKNNSFFFYIVLGFLLVLGAPYNSTWTDNLYFHRDIFNESPLNNGFRLFTSHLSHFNWFHWSANLFGVFLISSIYSTIKPKQIIRAFLIVIFVINIGLIFLYQRKFYLGFSSVFYGIFFYCAVIDFKFKPFVNSFLLFFVIGKQVLDYMLFDVQLTWLDIDVATEVHIWGIFGGIIAILVETFAVKGKY